MTARGEIYDSSRLAFGYAFKRPPVHARVLAIVAADLGLGAPVRRALDIGCGAGLSTAALAPVARLVVGLEPATDMLAFRREVAPDAHFVAGRAERLPFGDGTFDLVTAAGALNYVDLRLFLPEAARVLDRSGTLAVYDFSSGRRIEDDPTLERWFERFVDRYPFPGGYAFDLARLDDRSAGLRFVRRRDFEVSLPMTAEAYLDYVMTETNVEQAIQAGAPDDEVRAWCRAGLTRIFGDAPRDVLFEGYVVYVQRT